MGLCWLLRGVCMIWHKISLYRRESGFFLLEYLWASDKASVLDMKDEEMRYDVRK
jgi:hypothetical protein